MSTTLTERAADDVVAATRKSGTPKRGARVVPHLSVAERVARGRAARAEVPRHRQVKPAADVRAAQSSG